MALTKPKASQINFDLTNISDPIIRLNSNKTQANDTDVGFIFERGSSGDNAVLIWDESAAQFVVGTTTATGVTQGDLTVTNGNLQVDTIKNREQRYTTSNMMKFNQLYTGAASGSYFEQNEYQKIVTIIPSAASQNYQVSGRILCQTAGSIQTINFIAALRSNTLPDLDWSITYTEQHNGTAHFKPQLWTKETTTAGFIFAIQKISSGSLYGTVTVDLDVIPRASSQLDNVTVNTTQDSEQTSIDAGYTANDMTLVQSISGSAIEFSNAYTFPTADGSANQILQTDGSGTLSFVDNTGAGIGNVVEDTTPQLGGDLDLNSSDITGTGNINITGTATLSGNLTVDTNTLFVDASNNRVGIGTASPAYQVEIENTSANALLVLDRTDGASTFIEGGATDSVIGSVGSNDVKIAYNSVPVVTIGSGGAITTSGDVTAGTLTVSGELTVDTDTLYVDSTNNRVGIGTTSPTSLLHLKSTGPAILTLEADSDNATETDNARIELSQDGGVVTGSIGYANNTNSIELWNNYADHLIFGTNNTERMRIDSSGNVGIGTASPSTELEVVGTVTATLFDGTATSARYADLAENYVADAQYEPGTVLIFGGQHEVTASRQPDSNKIAGVVSTAPGVLMNKDCAGEFVVALAFTGRVPTKVKGTISKGDMMVSSNIEGVAVASNNPQIGTVIGKALENYDSEEVGVIEVVVGRL